MDANQFAKMLHSEILDECIPSYRVIYATELKDVTDPYYIKAISLFQSLDPSQREVLFSILRQTTVDALSQLLALLDGVSFAPDCPGEFRLTYEGQPLGNQLQEYFLMHEDER